jgi:hypothetical protein
VSARAELAANAAALTTTAMAMVFMGVCSSWELHLRRTAGAVYSSVFVTSREDATPISR